jgi:hypothetical protein
LSILAVLCGTASYDSIELFGKTNDAFLKQPLKLWHSVIRPLNRVFSILNSSQFEGLFIQWSGNLRKGGAPEPVIIIDWKTVCGSKDAFHNTSPIHLVHAWSVENSICLGQLKTETKSNGITAIPQILNLLEIKGCIITTDAMGTQKAIAEKDYRQRSPLDFFGK